MTGTGTQSDPYVPSTWSEFVTAIGTADAYVSCPSDTTWDMNETAPEGITSAVIISCKSIAGNGIIIKNLFFKSGGGFQNVKNTKTVTNIKFLNFLVTSGSVFVENKNSTDLQVKINFSQCTFTGKLVDSLFTKRKYYSSTSYYSTFTRCSFNMELGGEAAMCDGTNTTSAANVGAGFYQCHIKLTGTSTYSSNRPHFWIDYSLWEGSIVMPKVTIAAYSAANSNYSIFDCDISDTISGSNTTYIKCCIVNSDKVASGATVGTAFKQITSEQLRDASYLSSIGFPIAA